MNFIADKKNVYTFGRKSYLSVATHDFKNYKIGLKSVKVR